jgi:hypothetical protein
MATTITNATLTVTLAESVTLNGKAYGNSNTLTIADINEVDGRIMTIPTSEVDILAYDTAVGAGTFVGANVKYMRITNKDNANYVKLKIADGGSDHYWVKLEAGKSFMLHNNLIEAASPFSAFANIGTISAIADTAAVDIEYFIALS